MENKRLVALVLAVATLGVQASASKSKDAMATAVQRVTVMVYNYAGTAPQVLRSAQRDAQALFEPAATRVEWTDCLLERTACEHPLRPGDIVLGDADGLLVVPAEHAADIAARALEKRKTEESREARLRAGESIKSVLGL